MRSILRQPDQRHDSQQRHQHRGLAFFDCTSLTSVTIPDSVTNIGDDAFYDCTNLTGVYFKGHAPSLGSDVFDYDNQCDRLLLAGDHGLGTFPLWAGLPTVLWKPQVQTSDGNFGVRTNALDSPSPGPATWSSWWKPARTWPIPSGFRCKRTP